MKFRILSKALNNSLVVIIVGIILMIVGLTESIQFTPHDQICFGVTIIFWGLFSIFAQVLKTDKAYAIGWQIVSIIVLLFILIVSTVIFDSIR